MRIRLSFLFIVTATLAFAVCVPTLTNTTIADDEKAASAKDESDEEEEEGWERLTDGKTFGDWKPNENKDSWTIKDGVFIAKGPRSHLFYMGEDNKFKDFELKVDVKTLPGSNGGVYIHTRWQDEGWPDHGYETQVNVSHGDPVKSGSIYNTVKLYEDDIKDIIKDGEWWTQHIIVRGKRVVVKLNDKKVIDYTEPDDKEGTVRLSEGTFALQAHDPDSTIYFKDIRVKRLE